MAIWQNVRIRVQSDDLADVARLKDLLSARNDVRDVQAWVGKHGPVAAASCDPQRPDEVALAVARAVRQAFGAREVSVTVFAVPAAVADKTILRDGTEQG